MEGLIKHGTVLVIHEHVWLFRYFLEHFSKGNCKLENTARVWKEMGNRIRKEATESTKIEPHNLENVLNFVRNLEHF